MAGAASALYQHVGNEQARVSTEASTRTGLIAGLAGLTALGGLDLPGRTGSVHDLTIARTYALPDLYLHAVRGLSILADKGY